MSSQPTIPYPSSARHHAIRPDWLSLHHEQAIEPEMMIIDAHHHLWDRPGNRYLALDMLADAGSGHNLRATVAVECGTMYRQAGPAAFKPVGETEFFNGAGAMGASGVYGDCRLCAGIVGHADLSLGADVRPVLEAHVQAGGGRFRGVRDISAWHADPSARGSMANPPPGLLGDEKFRTGFACLAPLGLSFDAWMYHTQLSELVDLAQAFPQTTIVMNHVGGCLGIGPYAGRRDEVFGQWREQVLALSRCPNVHMKLGGLGMRMFGFEFADRDRPPPSEDLARAWRPYVETCIEAFGAQRCMYESNFPVDKGTCSYAVLWNAFKRISAQASVAEKQQLFHSTAARVYRLEL